MILSVAIKCEIILRKKINIILKMGWIWYCSSSYGRRGNLGILFGLNGEDTLFVTMVMGNQTTTYLMI